MASIEDFGALYYNTRSESDSPRMTDFNYTGAFTFQADEKQDLPYSTHSMDSSVEGSELASIAETDEDDELLKEDDDDATTDIEAQTPPAPAEYGVSTSRKLFFLSLYFVLNLSVTLSNKAILRTASYPWLLTFNHTFATSIGCTLLLLTGQLKLTQLSWRENLILVAFSTLFTLNIAISNVSLSLVSVPFHQVMRSTCPVVTILIYRFVYQRTYGTETYISMIPLILGVGLATYGDYYFSLVGFLLTVFGVLLASTKTVATNRLMTGSLKLSAMEVLFRMSPLAALQCILYGAGSGEIGRLWTSESEQNIFTLPFLLALLGNATMAFGLNLVSFQTNKVAGALTISVCGNVKQCLTILLGIVLFSVHVSPMNGVGMTVAVLGAAYYSKVELARKKAAETSK